MSKSYSCILDFIIAHLIGYRKRFMDYPHCKRSFIYIFIPIAGSLLSKDQLKGQFCLRGVWRLSLIVPHAHRTKNKTTPNGFTLRLAITIFVVYCRCLDQHLSTSSTIALLHCIQWRTSAMRWKSRPKCLPVVPKGLSPNFVICRCNT